jgi:hypothetical protein
VDNVDEKLQAVVAEAQQGHKISVFDRYPVSHDALWLLSCNDEKPNVSAAIKSRAQPGVISFVSNNVARNLQNERHFMMLIKHWEKTKKEMKGLGKIDYGALETLLQTSSHLADSNNYLYIGRELMGVITRSKNKSGVISSDDILRGEKCFRTDTQVKLENLLKNKNLACIPNNMGCVNVLGEATYKLLPQNEKVGIEGGSIGYAAPVLTHPTNWYYDFLEIISWQDYKTETNALQSVELLLKRHGQSLPVDLGARFDVTNFLGDYGSLVSGMYVSALSTLQNKPVKKDVLLALNINSDGSLNRFSGHLNNLIIRGMIDKSKYKEVIVSKQDFEERIDGSDAYGMKFVPVQNLIELYDILFES